MQFGVDAWNGAVRVAAAQCMHHVRPLAVARFTANSVDLAV
jgi:hypothetical protein